MIDPNADDDSPYIIGVVQFEVPSPAELGGIAHETLFYSFCSLSALATLLLSASPLAPR